MFHFKGQLDTCHTSPEIQSKDLQSFRPIFFKVKVRATSWSSRPVIAEPGSIWGLSFPWQELCPSRRWAPDLPPKPVDRRLQVWGDRPKPWLPPGAVRSTTPRHLVSMNTLSCHRAPHVPASTSLCLFIHYLLRSRNKVWNSDGWGVCRGSEWRHCLGQQKCQRRRVMGPPTGWQI